MAACGNEESLVMRSKLVKLMETISYKKEAAYKPKKEINKGAWTTKEDEKLAEVIAVHGPKRWKSIAMKAGLNRCGKSCRLRWLNYLRPNIKRGNITDQEEDLILRLHKLLGNRWSLIAGRLPGRTDNEIKNYWNSHLSKKINSKKKPDPVPLKRSSRPEKVLQTEESMADTNRVEAMTTKHLSTSAATTASEGDCVSSPRLSNPSLSDNAAADDDFFDFSNESTLNMEWVRRFLEFDRRHHQS